MHSIGILSCNCLLNEFKKKKSCMHCVTLEKSFGIQMYEKKVTRILYIFTSDVVSAKLCIQYSSKLRSTKGGICTKAHAMDE